MDSEREKEVLQTCEYLAIIYINSILELKNSEILNDIKEYPENVPEELLFQPSKKIIIDTTSKKTRKPRIKKESQKKVLKVSKIEQLEVEDLNNSASKRKCRYVGTYDIEKQLSVLLDEQSPPRLPAF